MKITIEWPQCQDCGHQTSLTDEEGEPLCWLCWDDRRESAEELRGEIQGEMLKEWPW